jgi:hypothetical protein
LDVLEFCIREFFKDEEGFKRENLERRTAGREGGDIDLLLGCLGCSNAGFGSVQNDDVVGRG